ncbi:MAG TPA: hypothetical protein P5169_03155, partial [Kiritimatiellia bacterium]|nr:hypothetical protein [Kiritimatiellia bacterium]
MGPLSVKQRQHMIPALNVRHFSSALVARAIAAPEVHGSDGSVVAKWNTSMVLVLASVFVFASLPCGRINRPTSTFCLSLWEGNVLGLEKSFPPQLPKLRRR